MERRSHVRGGAAAVGDVLTVRLLRALSPPPNKPMLVAAAVSIVAGGLVAAVTGPTGWDHGSWVAAFSVLVLGSVQAALAVVPSRPIAARGAFMPWIDAALWNGGGWAVVAGTLLSSPLLVTLGSLPLAIELALVALAARGGRSAAAMATSAVAIAVLISIPVGVVLSWIRH